MGVPNKEASLLREKMLVEWLSNAAKDADEIYLMGDVFDFWYEYKTVVPKGYVRLLGKLAELTDNGIKITAFKGNHDMWMFGYFEEELNIPVISDELIIERNGKKFYLHHGDGLGPGDKTYKFLRSVFRNPFCQWLFGRFHPNFGIGLANFFSKRSRNANKRDDKAYLGDDKEYTTLFCNDMLEKEHYDYFIFGHRHLPLEVNLNNNAKYINLGDWVHYFTYAVFDGKEVRLKKEVSTLIA